MPRTTHGRARRVAALVAGAALLATSLVVTAAPAQAVQTRSFLSLTHHGIAYGSRTHTLVEPAATFTAHRDAAGRVTVDAEQDGADLYRASVTIAPPTGEELGVGTYAGTERIPAEGRAGLSLMMNSTVCHTSNGQFTIRDIAFDVDGDVERLSMTFTSCATGSTPVIGEIQLNMPADPAGVSVAPRHIDYSDAHPAAGRQTVGVRLHNDSATAETLAPPAVSGVDADSFTVVSTTCAETLAPAATCEVGLRFSPPAPGRRTATLTVGGAESPRSVALTGSGIPGVTALSMAGTPGDSVVGDHSYEWHPADADLAGGSANGTSASVAIHTADDVRAQVTVRAPVGQSLEAGRSYPVSGPEPTSAYGAMSITHHHRSCYDLVGGFTVHELTRTAGVITALSFTWQATCSGATAPAYGSGSWRAAAHPDAVVDTTAPAPVAAVTAQGRMNGATLRWQEPADDDYALSVVRVHPGAVAPTAETGSPAFDGRGGTARVTGPVDGQTFTASIWSRDAAGNFSDRRTVIVRGTRLRLTRSAVSVTYGDRVAAIATLTDADSGGPVRYSKVNFYARRLGSTRWLPLGSAVTNSAGRAALGFAPTAYVQVIALYGGGVSRSGARGETVGIYVRHRVTAAAPTTAGVNRSFSIAGSVAPNRAGRTVSIMQRYSTGWRRISTAVLTSSSTYRWTTSRRAAGTVHYRVVMPYTAGVESSSSATLTVTVS